MVDSGIGCHSKALLRSCARYIASSRVWEHGTVIHHSWLGLVIEPLSSGSGLGSARKARLELGS